MSAPLVSDSEMAALRSLGLQGMQTSVSIERRTTVTTADGQESAWTALSTVDGWLHSEPTPLQTIVSGEITTVNTYRLFLPVGTDILPGDHAVIGDKTFLVSDTTAESTWQPMLRVSLRFAE